MTTITKEQYNKDMYRRVDAIHLILNLFFWSPILLGILFMLWPTYPPVCYEVPVLHILDDKFVIVDFNGKNEAINSTNAPFIGDEDTALLEVTYSKIGGYTWSMDIHPNYFTPEIRDELCNGSIAPYNGPD